MVKVIDNQDFNDKILGTGDKLSAKVDVKPDVQSGVNGSFVILFGGFLHEAMGNRLKKVILKHGSNVEQTTEVYLKIDGDDSPMILLGNVSFSMKFYKEIMNVFSSQQRDVSYKLYDNTELVEFNPDILIPTIKFQQKTTQDNFI